MHRFKEVETVDDNQLEKGLRSNVNIGEQYAKQNKLPEFQEMWDGQLDLIDVENRSIEPIAADVHTSSARATVLDRNQVSPRRWKSTKCYTSVKLSLNSQSGHPR